MNNNSIYNFRLFASCLLFSASMISLTNNANAGFVYTPAEPKPVVKSVPPPVITHDKTNVKEPIVEIKSKQIVTNMKPDDNIKADIIGIKEEIEPISVVEEVIISDNEIEIVEPIKTNSIEFVAIEEQKKTEPEKKEILNNNKKRILNGFGSDLPLKIAISQIIPVGYSVSLSDDINENELVSWNGGKSWTKILHESLQAVGLRANIKNNHITISRIPDIVNNISEPKKISKKEDTNNNDINETMGISPISAPIHDDEIDHVGIKQDDNNIVDATLGIDDSNLIVPEQLTEDIKELSMQAPEIISPVSLDIRTWQARHNTSLNVILSYWAETEDVEIYYNTDEKFYIDEPFYYKGTFAEAVNELLMSFAKHSPRPIGKLHVSETGGKPVLVIEVE